MHKFAIPPDQASYKVVDGLEVLYVELEGGLGRTRRDKLGAGCRVSASWTVGATDFHYIRSFYNVVGRQGLAFNIDVILDDSILETREAKFIPGTFALSSQTGQKYVVEAQLEVKPSPRALSTDEAEVTARDP